MAQHRITVGEELRYDGDVRGVRALAGTYVQAFPVAAPSGDITGTADTARIQAQINAAAAVGGGCVYLQSGTYWATGLLIRSGVTIAGAGQIATTIKLPNGANADLVTVPNFATLSGSNSQAGEAGFGFRDLTLHGNGDNQTGTSWTFRVYGTNYRMTDVQILRGRTGNVYSEWSNSGGGDMEAVWNTFKVREAFGKNIDWNGPHDSIFNNGEIVSLSGAFHSTYGIHTRGNAAGEMFTNVHVWGFHDYGWVFEHSVSTANCSAEGARNVNVLALVSNVNWKGAIFGTNDFHTGEIGLQIGDASHTGITGVRVEADFSLFGATSTPINIYSSNGANRITGKWTRAGGTSSLYTGTLDTKDSVDVICPDDQTKTLVQFGHGINVIGYAGDQAPFTAKQSGLTVFNIPGSGQLVQLVNSCVLKGYKDLFTTPTVAISGADGSVQPGTPAGIGFRIFSGTGAPDIAGTAGDVYMRGDTPSTVGQQMYQCVTTGAAGAAVWRRLAPASRQQLAIAARGLISEPYPLQSAVNTQALTSGTLYAQLVGLHAGDTVTSVVAGISVVASGLTLAKVGLYSSAGALLASSADLSGGVALTSTGLRTAALSSPYAVTSDGGYYVAILCVGTTPPTLFRGMAQGVISGGVGAGVGMSGTQGSLSDLPASLAITTTNTAWLAAA